MLCVDEREQRERAITNIAFYAKRECMNEPFVSVFAVEKSVSGISGGWVFVAHVERVRGSRAADTRRATSVS